MISIIIPNFNKGDFILKTLISVNEQTFNDWECIIVDDNSTDNSVEIIKSFVKNKSKFEVISQINNSGASSCRNIGLEVSKGEFVIFLDSDDLLSKSCLNNRIKIMSNNSKLDFSVFPMGTFFNELGDSNYIWNKFHGNHLKRFLSHDLPWAICSVIWRKRSLIQIGGFDESFVRLQDVELHTRALISNKLNYQTFKNLNPDCFYRISDARIYSFVDFIKNDISGKLFYIENFNYLTQKNKNLNNYLIITLLECYNPLFYYYHQSKISREELKKILKFLNNHKLNIMPSKLHNSILNIYCFLRFKKIYIRGMNYMFRKILLKLS